MVFQPLASLIECLDLFRCERLVIHGSIGDGTSHRISHDPKQMDDGGELTSIELIEELVGLLFFVRGCHQNQSTNLRVRDLCAGFRSPHSAERVNQTNHGPLILLRQTRHLLKLLP